MYEMNLTIDYLYKYTLFLVTLVSTQDFCLHQGLLKVYAIREDAWYVGDCLCP